MRTPRTSLPTRLRHALARFWTTPQTPSDAGPGWPVPALRDYPVARHRHR
jgi:hypothetical protein